MTTVIDNPQLHLSVKGSVMVQLITDHTRPQYQVALDETTLLFDDAQFFIDGKGGLVIVREGQVVAYLTPKTYEMVVVLEL